MHDKINITGVAVAVIFSAFGIAVPVLFHLIGLGSIFLPMYLPLVIGAFLLGKKDALMMGAFTPLVSALVTGMPPLYPPVAFMMSIQLAAQCLLVSFLAHRARSLSRWHVVAIVLVSFVAERALYSLLNFIVMPLLGISGGLMSLYGILKGAPGIILISIAAPFAVPKFLHLVNRFALRPYERNSVPGGE